MASRSEAHVQTLHLTEIIIIIIKNAKFSMPKVNKNCKDTITV